MSFRCRCLLNLTTALTAAPLSAQAGAPATAPQTSQDTASIYLAAAEALAESLTVWADSQPVVLAIPDFPTDTASQGKLVRSLSRLSFARVCLHGDCSPLFGEQLTLGPLEPYGSGVLVPLERPSPPAARSSLAPWWLPPSWAETFRLAIPLSRAPPLSSSCNQSAQGPPVALLLARDAAGRWRPQQVSVVLRLCR